MESAPPDFRTRVAAEKRDRMRARLLDATMSVCGQVELGGAGVVVDDVVRTAGVSRGAFYRHFRSLDEAVGALVADLVRQIVADAQEVFVDERDPVVGMALGTQLFLNRAAMDPAWSRFISAGGGVLRDPALLAVLQAPLALGRKAGGFRFTSMDAAMDIILGGLLAGARRLEGVGAEAGDYISEACGLMLRAVGASEAGVEAAVAEARTRIAEAAPGRLAWWRAA